MALISPVTSQNDDLQRTIEQLHYQGAEDILVNAPQQSAYCNSGWLYPTW